MTTALSIFLKFLLRKEPKRYQFFSLVFSLFLIPATIVKPAMSAVPAVQVTGIKFEVINEGYVIGEITLSKLTKIRYKRLPDQNVVYLDIYNAKLGKSIKREMRVSPFSIVKRVLSAQNRGDRVRVVFGLRESVRVQVHKIAEPARIEIHIKSKRKIKVTGKKKRKKKAAGVSTRRMPILDPGDPVSRARTMDEAQIALESKKYDRAIRLYGKILELPQNSFTPEALEYMGVAREKNGQGAHAKASYKEYLKRYPLSDGAKRVRRRLKSLAEKARKMVQKLKHATSALGKGKYTRAIKLYTEILEQGAHREKALELLGVSYEKDGQIDDAIDKFTRYLQFYPEGPGAARVRARLKVLWEKDKRSDKKFAEAGRALTGGEYKRSAKLYMSLLESEKHKERALEFLGLSYEKNSQLARAMSTYEEYLKLYPKEKGSGRVRQRLAGLQTAKLAARKKLKKAKKRVDRSDIYGSFSQSYDRDDSYTDLGNIENNTSSLTTDFSFNYRGRKEFYDSRSVITGGYEHDFKDSEDSTYRLRRFYFELLNKPKQISMRVGRQQSSSGGVFSRFDGGLFRMRLNKQMKLNVVTGLPMDTTKLDTYETRKYFFGVNVDIGTFKERWDFNVFVINQMVDGMIDRQGAGGEVRYFYERQSIFSYLDYDFFFNELNVFLFSGNLTFAGKTTVNFSLDYRKSPLLTTSNAITGQNVTSPAELTDKFGKSEIHSLAKDRTATSKSVLVGFTRPLNEKLQISGDVNITNFSGTKGSGGVEGFDGTGNDYFYNLQLVGNSFIMENDIAIFGLRYSDASTSDTYSVSLNTRYPFTRNFKVNPRIRVKYKVREKEERLRVLPTVRMNYRWRKTIWFDFDSGFDWDKSLTDDSDTTTSYSFSIGYRVEF